MPIIAEIGRKTFHGRLTMACLYGALTLLGATMVYPFLITISSSLSDGFDYDRFSAVPRYLFSRTDRFVKGLDVYFSTYQDWHRQMRACFHNMPASWNSWQEIGHDTRAIDHVAQDYLHPSSAQLARWKRMAADYSEFVDEYPVEDMLCVPFDRDSSRFLLDRYEILWAEQNPAQAAKTSAHEKRAKAFKLLEKTWGIPLPSIQAVSYSTSEVNLPIWQQTWFPPYDAKYLDFQQVKAAGKHCYFQPEVRGRWFRYLADHGQRTRIFPVQDDSPPEVRSLWTQFKAEVAPAARVTPLAMRAVWRKYFESEEVRNLAGLKNSQEFDVATYNRLAGTHYASLADTPFPLPADSGEGMQKLWKHFVETRYPLRLTTLRATSALSQQYQELLRSRFKTLAYANRILDTHAQRWEDFVLTPTAPTGKENENLRSVWADFAITVPAEDKILTSSEHAFQSFLLARYGSLDKINKAYGWNLGRIEEAFPPFDAAYAMTFFQNEHAFSLGPMARNYAAVWDFLQGRGNALVVTIILIVLAILATLTINPLAAYALSRFNIRGKERVILYLLATMAFPAMVSAIPAYLLMRDLNLLNTFFALVLPGAANGMAIFILKGFFDSLPSELYDAATIDGANEWQIFTRVTMPMMKPILAINALGAFLWAYNSWEWALIICQKQSMWTLAVWLYQANQWWAATPWISTAGFIVVSIPTLLVFLFCQKIILRGIILPSMK